MILLVQDLDVRIVNAVTGELIRDLSLNPNVDYQGTGAPKGPTRRPQNDHCRTRSCRSGSFLCPETSHGRADRI